MYAKASHQDHLEAAKVQSWFQERLLDCSRNLEKQHFMKHAGWITIVGPGGGGIVETHWFDVIQIKGRVPQQVEAACLFWMRRNRICQNGQKGDLSSNVRAPEP